MAATSTRSTSRSTGSFFDEPTVDAVRAAITTSRDREWDPDAIRAHAEAFSEERFHERIRAEVDRMLE